MVVSGGVPSSDNANDFLEATGQKFKESDKAEFTNLFNNFPNARHDNTGGVRIIFWKAFRL